MSATILGAATTLSMEMKVDSPDYITIDAQSNKILIAKAGERALISTIIRSESDPNQVRNVLVSAAKEIEAMGTEIK